MQKVGPNHALPNAPYTAAKHKRPNLAVGAFFVWNGLPDVLDNDAAVGLYTGGMGGDIVHILQGSMDHMTLICVHGLQGGAATGLQNLLCLLAGIAAEAVLTLLPVALGIHIDAERDKRVIRK